MSLMALQHALTRKTAFWIAGVLTVFLLAIHVVASTHVTHLDTTDLGLVTKLPITFWIGLSCLGVLLYVSRKSNRRTVVVVALISLYLFGVPVLMRENKAEWLQISYYHSSQGVQLLSEGHLTLPTTTYPTDPRNWPGFFYFVAFISAVTGIPNTVLCDYFPFLTISLLGVITYLILRLQSQPLYSSFGTLWFLGSFWVSQHYFSPQSVAYVMYFAIFLLLAKLFFNKNKPSINFPLSIIFLFTATVFSHLLTAFMIVAGVVAIYVSCKILHKKNKAVPFYSIVACTLLASIFFSYQFFVASRSFSSIVLVLYEGISRQETHLSAVLMPRIIGSTNYLLELVSTYSIAIINVVIAIFAILKTALDRLVYKRGTKHNVFWIAWIIVAGIFGVSMKYGFYEAIERGFMFMLLPTCYFSVKFISKKPRMLILILIALSFLNIPAQYTKDTYLYVPTSELVGAAFYSHTTTPKTPYFYDYNWRLILYYDPNRTGTPKFSIGRPPFHVLNNTFVNEEIGKAGYVISSSSQENYYLYFLGVNPLKQLDLNVHYNQVYDNGGFWVYQKTLQH